MLCNISGLASYCNFVVEYRNGFDIRAADALLIIGEEEIEKTSPIYFTLILVPTMELLDQVKELN